MLRKRNKTSNTNRTTILIVLLLLTSSGVRIVGTASEAVANQPGGIEEPKNDEAKTSSTPSPERLTDLLTAFKEREAKISEQEEYISTRMRELEKVEKQLGEKLIELTQAEAKLRETLAFASTAAEDDLTRLTAVYESMKSKTAATLFEEMAPDFAAGFIGRMRADSAGAIMANMSPEKAYSISAILAGRNANVPTR